MDRQDKKKPDTDHLSIYDLPALNAVIDQYEQPKTKGVEPKSENASQHPTSVQG